MDEAEDEAENSDEKESEEGDEDEPRKGPKRRIHEENSDEERRPNKRMRTNTVTLTEPLDALRRWAERHIEAVTAARSRTEGDKGTDGKDGAMTAHCGALR